MKGLWLGLCHSCVQLESITEQTQPSRGHGIFIVMLTFVTHSLLPPITSLPVFYVVLSVSHQPLVSSEKGGNNKHGDARTRGGKNTKHALVLNINPFTGRACACTRTQVYTHILPGTHTHTPAYQTLLCRLNRKHLYFRLKRQGLWGIQGECLSLGVGWGG